MTKRIKTANKKGFTLIELIVVLAVLAVLVLLAAPRFIGQTNEAQFTKHINNAKVMEDAAERYYIDHGKWPRADVDPYTAEEVNAYAENIYDITGKKLAIEDGDYWDIDYDVIKKYAKLPDEEERDNYILRNPVGKIYYLEGLTMAGEDRNPDNPTGPVTPEIPNETPPAEPENPETPESPSEDDRSTCETTKQDWVPLSAYEETTDADWSGSTNGLFKYIGTAKYVIIPDVIKGKPVTSYFDMFRYTDVAGVASTNTNITSMEKMFYGSKAVSMDLTYLADTGNVITMDNMFSVSNIQDYNFGNINTSNVKSMMSMFSSSKAEKLDLTSFDTRKVTKWNHMFSSAAVTCLDISTFDMRNANSAVNMFLNVSLRGELRLRSGYEVYYLNTGFASEPDGLTFVRIPSPNEYILATDDDFYGGNYRGSAEYVIIPDIIQGKSRTTYGLMFEGTDVRGVISTNPNIISFSGMFIRSTAETIDLSGLNTDSAVNYTSMFQDSNVSKIIGFNVDSTKLIYFSNAFQSSKALVLDLSDVTLPETNIMLDDTFMYTKAKTVYTRTQGDADRFNASPNKPSGMTFIVKP